MGKRHKTAKTGDKALYKQGAKHEKVTKSKAPVDNSDAAIDKFHDERNEEFMKLEAGNPSNDEDDDMIQSQEAVLDLGMDGSDSDSDVPSDDDDDDDNMSASSSDTGNDHAKPQHSASESDDDSDSGDMGAIDPRNWGKQKSLYYHGDTADLEIGQDQEDAFLEEEAAKEVEAARLQEMKEDDFELSDGEEEEGVDATQANQSLRERTGGTFQAVRDVTKLSKADKRKLLHKQHEELLPIADYFSEVFQKLKARTGVATQVVLDSDEATTTAIGTTNDGKSFLVTKMLLQSALALNVSMYLLIKSQDDSKSGGFDSSRIKAHPVLLRLQQLNSVAQKLSDVESELPNINEEIANLIKAAALMHDDGADASDETSDGPGGVSTEQNADRSGDSPELLNNTVTKNSVNTTAMISGTANSMNEAKFGLRRNEVGAGARRNVKLVRNLVDAEDFGEDEAKATGTNRFASTMNAIDQRRKSRKRRQAPEVEKIDDHNDEYESSQGVKMMEDAILADPEAKPARSTNQGGVEASGDKTAKDSFYQKMAKRGKEKKQFKKSLYQVAPKYPKMDAVVRGERAISRTIMKNRGLVPHKAKINRNPRVKKREQYRKALVRRKGAVREVRTNEGHKYGGEETGIKSAISRSRKLAG